MLGQYKAAALAATLVVAFASGALAARSYLNARHGAELLSIDAANKTNLAAALKEARRQEQADAGKAAAIDKKLIGELQNEKQKAAAIVAGLRAGEHKLRHKFTCPGTSGGVPAQANAPGSGDAGTAGGLQNQDAEFLISVAAEADEVVLQLQACQGLLRTDDAQVRKEIISSIKGRLEFMAANPVVHAAVNPALPYQDLILSINELETVK